jgi:hypothetical protein
VNPVTGIQKLTGFYDHFYYMFVAVIFGAFAGIPVEEEDIHLELELDGLFTMYPSINPFLLTLLELEPELVQAGERVKAQGQGWGLQFP